MKNDAKTNLSLLIAKLIKEQLGDEPKTPYYSAKEKKPFSSDIVEKIIQDEIISGRVVDQSSLDSLFEALNQSISELRAIPFDIFIDSQQLKMK